MPTQFSSASYIVLQYWAFATYSYLARLNNNSTPVTCRIVSLPSWALAPARNVQKFKSKTYQATR